MSSAIFLSNIQKNLRNFYLPLLYPFLHENATERQKKLPFRKNFCKIGHDGTPHRTFG